MMLRLALFAFCVLVCTFVVSANTDAPVPTTNDLTTPKPAPTTTTTKAPVATHSSTTTKTTASQDTTTTKSTQAPSTTTTPTPAPVPNPNNEVPSKPVPSKIEVRDPKENSSLCFKAEFNFEFDIHYNNSKGSLTEKHIYLPKLDKDGDRAVQVAGCAKSKNLTVPLEWRWNNQTWNASLTFAANNETYNLTGVEALFPNDDQFFPGNADNTSQFLSFGNSSILGFPGHLNRMYKCDAEEAVIVQPNKFVIKVSHLKIQAFRFKYNDTYNKERDVCSADEPSSTMVPIIVGCVLAGLIVIVIVAYVIATRKFKKYHGYETL